MPNASSAEPVVIVTGAGRGIGRACVELFCRNHYNAVAVSRTKSELETTAQRAGCTQVETIIGDVKDPSVATRAVNRAMEKWGRVDVLVNCAGVAPLRPVEETSVELFAEVVATNLGAAFAFSRAVWGPMVQQKSGAIISISSMASRDPFPGFSAYAAAKGGINSMTLALDKEGRPKRIRAYAVAPGAVETAMFRSLMSPEQYPTEQTLTPEQVAEVVYQCAAGALTHSGGETIFLSRG